MRLIFSLFCLLTLAPASAQTSLTPAQIAKLKQFGPKVVAASCIPSGAKLTNVDVRIDKRFGNSYNLKYKGPGKAEFTVQGANGGIGDGPDGDPYPFNSPLFGKGTLSWRKDEGGIFSGWLSFSGQRFAVFSLSGFNMDAKTSVKIVESFQLLK